MISASYPARQRNRRLARSVQEAIAALTMFALAGVAASVGAATVGTALVVLSGAFAVGCWRSLRLARRSAIGARSEQGVRAQLEALEREGWRIRHSLRWHGGGDIDHIAIAPGRVQMAFAIETKTRTYRPLDLGRISAVTRCLAEHRSAWCHCRAVPVLCLASARHVERWESGVAIVSLDRLAPVLRRQAGTTPRPGFLR